MLAPNWDAAFDFIWGLEREFKTEGLSQDVIRHSFFLVCGPCRAVLLKLRCAGRSAGGWDKMQIRGSRGAGGLALLTCCCWVPATLVVVSQERTIFIDTYLTLWTPVFLTSLYTIAQTGNLYLDFHVFPTPRPFSTHCICFCFSFYLSTPSSPSSPVSSALPKETSFVLARTWSANFRWDPTVSPGAMLFWWLLEIAYLYPCPSISCDLLCLWPPNMVHLGTSVLLSCLLSLLFPDSENVLP